MRTCAAALLLFLPWNPSHPQKTNSAESSRIPVTMPAIIDHNRVIIDVDLPLPDGTTQKVHAWVDNGNPDLGMSRRLATLLGLAVTCGDQECSSPPPHAIRISAMDIPLEGIKEAHIPLKPVSAASLLAPGMHAEINIPSTVLRHYDVLIDYPGKKFSIGMPGSIPFRGSSGKVQVNPENGLIQVPGEIEKKKYNLALDVGASISFLAEEVFASLSAAHPDWPHMTGAVGPANIWGLDEEPKWKLMRVDRIRYGPLFLTDVPLVNFPEDRMEYFKKRAAVPTAGLLGGDVFLNYRVGLDYAHSTVYFDLGTFTKFPAFEVIGLVLRPEDDGRFTILGLADEEAGASAATGAEVQAGDSLVAVDGIPVRGSTMGEVWKMLGGTPGQERKLTIERAGRQFTRAAKVKNFLPELAEERRPKQKK